MCVKFFDIKELENCLHNVNNINVVKNTDSTLQNSSRIRVASIEMEKFA